MAALRGRGVDFLSLPDTYYEVVWDRVDRTLREHGHEPVKEDHQRIRDLGDQFITLTQGSMETTIITSASLVPTIEKALAVD